MTVKVQVVAKPQVIEGKAKATGNDYKMTIVQAIVQVDGEGAMVAEIMLPRDHPEVFPGMYEANFGPFIDRQTKRLGGQLIGLTPVGKSSNSFDDLKK
jgi:hypothetical protein